MKTHLTVTDRLNLDGRSQLFTIVTRLSPCRVEKPVEVPPSANSTQLSADRTRALSCCPAIVYKRNERSSAIRPATVSLALPLRNEIRAGPGSVKPSPAPSSRFSVSSVSLGFRFSRRSSVLAGVAVSAGEGIGDGNEGVRFSAGRGAYEGVLAGADARSLEDDSSMGRRKSIAATAATAATVSSRTAGTAHFSHPGDLRPGIVDGMAGPVLLGALMTVGSSPAADGSGESALPSCRQYIRSSG